MAEDGKEFIKLGDASRAPVLDYDVPEPTSYTGTHYVRLTGLPDAIWTERARELPTVAAGRRDQAAVAATEAALREAGPIDLQALLRGKGAGGAQPAPSPSLDVQGAATELLSERLIFHRPETVTDKVISVQAAMGRVPVLRPSLSGEIVTFLPKEDVEPPETARPGLMLVEAYRLSTYSGNYGAGKTLKTFTLLPGEKTKISVKSYTRRKESAKEASSVLDSFTQTSSDAFEKSVQSENTDKKNQTSSLDWEVKAEGSASWGVASVRASAEVKGSSASAREEFSKNVSNATTKHANDASAKRDVQVNTSSESSTEMGEEQTIERTLENINVSRTLNFVFRQMNQEFISVLHLVDVRVAFVNGDREASRVVALSALDELLEDYVRDTAMVGATPAREYVRAAVRDELDAIQDWRGRYVQDLDASERFVDEATTRGGSTYLRVRRERTDSVSRGREPGPNDIRVPGVVTDVNRNVMRTDGIVVEAILGQGEALDAYSVGLQTTAVEEKRTANRRAELELRQLEAAVDILQRKDEEAAAVYAQLFPPPPSRPDEPANPTPPPGNG